MHRQTQRGCDTVTTIPTAGYQSAAEVGISCVRQTSAMYLSQTQSEASLMASGQFLGARLNTRQQQMYPKTVVTVTTLSDISTSREVITEA
ncbi:hypothetical protein BaRGS_00021405 [Batillaria attramentaria]|uniref:Uncharacterized protein n=1 Tax=Batillaria attramentaria TaxID=370345 RepID=A0ABD0KJ98_9CAEN